MRWYLHREQTWFGRLLNRWARWRCTHVVYYMETMTERDAAGNVHATCDKCGKELVADCGLSLPAELRGPGWRERERAACTPECGEKACDDCPI